MLRWLLIGGIATAVLAGAGFALQSDEPSPAPAPSDQRFLAVHVVNPGRSRLERVDVRITAGRIASIVPSTAAPGESGGFLLPGFVDSHVHPAFTDDDTELVARLRLLHGVTSVRTLAAAPSIFDYQAEVAAGRRSRPSAASAATASGPAPGSCTGTD